MSAARPDQRFGAWTLVVPIGRGGMGEVWLARGDDGREAALKVIFARPDRRESATRRFEREVAAASQIGHPAIAEVLDFGVEDAVMYLAMELLEGRSLRAWIDDGAGSPADALALFEALLEPLAVAHALRDEAGEPTPIIHRDLKPENVFVLEPPLGELTLKLLDFGIARQAGPDETRVTDTGVGLGTAAYMSPEQATDATRVGPRSDVFSLGVMLYELLAGVRPFDAPSRNEVIAQILTTDPRPLREHAPAVSPGLAALVERCLAKAPERRPADAGALVEALTQARQNPEAAAPVSAALATQTAATFDPGPPERPRRTWLFVALGVGALAALGASAVITTPEPFERAPSTEADTDAGAAETLDAGASEPAAPSNAFVSVAPGPALLGIAEAAEGETGFRFAADMRGPAEPFLLQRHEVTWGELEPWLDASRRDMPAVIGRGRPDWLGDGAARARFPATGVTWELAHDYCASLGGALPTEEQWEHAARGLDRRAYPSGAHAPSEDAINVGPDPAAHPHEVMTSPGDRTPGADEGALYDLLGNAREWTADVYRQDADGALAEWARADGLTYRAVRGLPLIEASRWRVPRAAPLAHRVPLCAAGACAEGTEQARLDVGFRCVRAAEAGAQR